MAQAMVQSGIREEMRRHRAATPVKRPVHPGLTRTEAGITAAQAELLAAGVCDELAGATEAGERWANRLVVGLVLLLCMMAFAGLMGGTGQ